MYARTTGDDRPRLTYFISATQLSFHWGGQIGDPIEIEWGGDGEPVIDFIRVYGSLTLRNMSSPSELLAWFKAICDEWAANWDGDTTPL